MPGQTAVSSSVGSYPRVKDEVADSYRRMSVYVTVDDGCRIAIDILIPALGGQPLPGPFPVVMTATGYRRAFRKVADDVLVRRAGDYVAALPDGHLLTAYELAPGVRQRMRAGFAHVSMDFRGTGASFGADALGMWRIAADVAQVIDWVGAQPWCTGKVGMIGGSWAGVVQIMAAVYQPRHLACITPLAAAPMCRTAYDEGVLVSGFLEEWSGVRQRQDTEIRAEPVDGEDGSRLFDEAQAERRPLYPSSEPASPVDVNALTVEMGEAVAAYGAPPPPLPHLGPLGDPYDQVERLNAAGIPIYFSTGWWDQTFAGHTIDLFRALEVPKRLIVGAWNHAQASDVDAFRWFDFWLRDVDNGIMDEPPLAFAISDRHGVQRWMATRQWPVAETSTTWHLGENGTLCEDRPANPAEVPYLVTQQPDLGPNSRHRFMFRHNQITYEQLDERADLCLSFTTGPLDAAIEILGRCVVDLQLTTSATSGIVVATLEELAEDAPSAYITEGFLNFAHRKISANPRPHDGRAWHSVRAADLLPVIPDEPMRLTFELQPVGWRTTAGSRLRLTLAGADPSNLYADVHDPSALLRLQLGGADPSRLELPIASSEALRHLSIANAWQDERPAFAFTCTPAGPSPRRSRNGARH